MSGRLHQNVNRRNFLTGKPAAQTKRPPWSSAVSVTHHCTGCGECVAACPERILFVDDSRLVAVRVDGGECTFCGDCAAACAEPVFDRDRLPPWPWKAAISGACLTLNQTHCRSCGDVCPEGAIAFRPIRNGPPVPILTDADCTGCGACVVPCPVDAIRMTAETEAA